MTPCGMPCHPDLLESPCRNWLIGLCERGFPAKRCPLIVDQVLKGSCWSLEQIIANAGATLNNKQKEDLRKTVEKPRLNARSDNANVSTNARLCVAKWPPSAWKALQAADYQGWPVHQRRRCRQSLDHPCGTVAIPELRSANRDSPPVTAPKNLLRIVSLVTEVPKHLRARFAAGDGRAVGEPSIEPRARSMLPPPDVDQTRGLSSRCMKRSICSPTRP